MPLRISENLFELSADRTTIKPGETVVLAFRFANVGSAATREASVFFALPASLSVVDGTAALDETVFAAKDRLPSGGWKLPALEPDAEHVATVTLKAADAIDDGTDLTLHAALVDERGEQQSNAVVFAVRSSEILKNSSTRLKLETIAGVRNELAFSLHVRNTGASRARAVEIAMPLPGGASFITDSLALGGADLVSADADLLRLAVAEVPAQATIAVQGRIALDAPFESELVVVDDVMVTSAATVAFALPRASVRAHTDIDFSTSVLEAPAGPVVPGERLHFAFTANNTGRSPALDVAVTAQLPAGLAYAPGTRTQNDAPLGERDELDPIVFELDRIEPGQSVTFGFDALVLAPCADGTELATTLDLAWRDGESRRYPHACTVRSSARLSGTRSWLERIDHERVDAGTSVRFALALMNDGGTTAHGTKVRFEPANFVSLTIAGDGLETLRDAYDARLRKIVYWLDVGDLAPHERFSLIVTGAVPQTLTDRTEVSLAAFAQADGLPELAIGTSRAIVRSSGVMRAQSSNMRVIAPAPVRLQQTCEVRVHLKNEGTDLLRDVRCELDLPSALVIEGVSGASAVGGRLTFADIPPGAPLEAALTLRLVEAQISGTSVPLRAIVSAAHQQPLILSAAVETFAMPQLESAQLAVRGMMGPAPFAPGDTIECELSVENVGDGVAERLTIEAHGDAALVPLAGTTRVDGIAVSEYNDRVRLYGTRGLTLAELAPGAPLRVRWQARIAADALDERSLVVRAGVRVGDADPLVVASAPFAIAPRPVRAPAPPPIAETEPSYPPPAPWPEVVPEPEPEYEPEPEPVVMDEVPAHEHDPAIAFVAMRCDLDRLRLARILKQLRSLRDREDGLLFRHVLVPRFFWPDHIDDGAPAFDRERLHMAALLETARESIRTLTTAVLLKIGVPGTDIDTDVIESLHDDRLRSALRALLTELADAPGLVVEPSAGRSLASLTTSVSLATLRRLGAEYGDGDHDDVLATSRVIAFFMTTQSAFPAVQLAMTEYWNELIRTLELCRSTDDLFDIAPQTLDERLAELIDVFDENQERFAGDAEESAAAS